MTSTEHSSVIRPVDDGLQLLRAGSRLPQPVAETGDLPKGAVFAVPTESLRLTVIDVSPDEAKHLSKSLPFMLEDDVLEDVDTLHFASRPIGDGRWLVAVVAREHMATWSAMLPDDWQGAWVPDALLLPWQSGEVCLLIEEESALIRFDQWLGCRVERKLVEAVIASLPTELDAIVIYGNAEQEDKSLIPENHHDRVQWRQGSLATAMMLAPPLDISFDIRQGEFAPRLPIARWWQHWQRIAVAAGIALVLQLGSDLAQYQRLKADNLSLRTAIQESYRAVNPRGAVVDVEKQLDRQIAEFNPAISGLPFTPTLAAITGLVAQDDDLSISTLNFSAGSGEVRLDVVADDYAAVESLRRRLDADGLAASLETSSSREDRVRARLRVEGGV